MPRPSGLPKTGGRKKGTPNKKTQEQIEAVKSDGITPLEYLLQVMRDEGREPNVRIDAAKAAAPYVHAKLSSVELGNRDGETFRVEIGAKDAEVL